MQAMDHHYVQNEQTYRKVLSSQPEQLLSPPYELRTEMVWSDYSTISNPLGTPDVMIKAMRQAFFSGEVNYPPDRDSHSFRSALARHFGIPADSFLCGTSVGDMIRAVAQTYQPCTVGITSPCPAEYALAISNAGHNFIDIAIPSGFIVPDPQFASNYGITFDAAVLSNPTFPTSRLLPEPTLIKYLKTCKWVIVDERSIELTLGGETFVPLVNQYHNLIIIRSLSESFALPGIPISYCVAHPDTIAQITNFFDKSAITMFPEILSPYLSDATDYFEKTRDLLETEIPWMQCMLNLVPGVRIFPAEANYVMCQYVNDGTLDLAVADVNELTGRLQLMGYLIRKIEGIPGLRDNSYFCVSIKTRPENEQLINVLKKTIRGEY